MKRKICILGGTGFVGHHVVSSLVRDGHDVRLLTRHPERHRDLLVLPTVEIFKADTHDLKRLKHYFSGQDAVINLVGILNEPRDNGKGFYRVHVELAEKVIKACKANGIKRLLHMSALNADPAVGSSYYLRSKGEAEHRVHAAPDMDVTSFRPSVIFGPGDSFINRFAMLAKFMPLVFPLACGNSRFAPVYVEDVANAFAKSLNDPSTYGQRYNLCGPHQYTLAGLVNYVVKQLGLKRKIISLGKMNSLLQANIMQYVPGKPFSRDNYRSLQTDSICEEGDRVLREVFDITPTAIESAVPRYLINDTTRTKYNRFRRVAGREQR